jgi:integrase/recombinase XerD
MQLTKALEGFIVSKQADGMSPETIKLYRMCMGAMAKYLHDPEVNSVSGGDLQGFFTWLRTPEKHYSESTIQIYWRCMRAFYKWAQPVLHTERPDLIIQRPRAPEKAVIPFSEEEIKKLLSACDYTVFAKTKDRSSYKMKRPTAKRDRAIVLTLLDTGLRASELCRLTIADIHLDTGQVEVKIFRSGKKSRPRVVYLGKTARKVLWLYLAEKEDPDATDTFFTANNRPMNRDSLRHVLNELGTRAGVNNCYPHRFRHTFAIQYLRNGGDVFSLQRQLGHSTLEMVRHYLAIADTDSENAHRRASPADNWKL